MLGASRATSTSQLLSFIRDGDDEGPQQHTHSRFQHVIPSLPINKVHALNATSKHPHQTLYNEDGEAEEAEEEPVVVMMETVVTTVNGQGVGREEEEETVLAALVEPDNRKVEEMLAAAVFGDDEEDHELLRVDGAEPVPLHSLKVSSSSAVVGVGGGGGGGGVSGASSSRASMRGDRDRNSVRGKVAEKVVMVTPRTAAAQASATSAPTVALVTGGGTVDQVVRKNMQAMMHQVDSLKKRLAQEALKRHDVERNRQSLEDENADLKMRFLLKVERLEKELLFYRNEFTDIERRNDMLEGMREDFLRLVEHAQEQCANLWYSLRMRELTLRCFKALRDNAIYEKQRKFELTKFEGRRMAAWTARAFSEWRHYADDCKTQRQLRAKAEKWHHRVLMSRALRAMRMFTENQHLMKNKLASILHVPDRLRMHWVFDTWRRWVGSLHMSRMQEAYERSHASDTWHRERSKRSLDERRNMRLVRDVFVMWQSWTRKCARAETKGVEARQRQYINDMSVVFCAWRDHVKRIRRIRRIAIERLRLKGKELVSECFVEWREFAMQSKRAKLEESYRQTMADHQMLEADVGALLRTWKLNSQRRLFNAWRTRVEQLQHNRTILRRVLMRYRNHMLAAAWERWRAYIDERAHMATLRKRADQFANWRLKLRVFREWQGFNVERQRSKMTSHKISLGLHMKSLNNTGETMSYVMDDLRRDRQNRNAELLLVRDEDRMASRRLIELAQRAQSDVLDMQRTQDAERLGWESKTRQQYEDFVPVLEATGKNRHALESILAFVKRELSELATKNITDRFTMKKNFERVLLSIQQKVDTTVHQCEAIEDKYCRNQEFMQHALDEEAESVRHHQVITLRAVESMDALVKLVGVNDVDMEKRYASQLTDVEALEAKLAEARATIEELRQRMQESQTEFEAMMRFYQEDDDLNSSGSASVFSGVSGTSVLDLPEGVDAGQRLDAIIADAKRMREEDSAAAESPKDSSRSSAPTAASSQQRTPPGARSGRTRVSFNPEVVMDESTTSPTGATGAGSSGEEGASSEGGEGTGENESVQPPAAAAAAEPETSEVADAGQSPAKGKRGSFDIPEIPAHKSGARPPPSTLPNALSSPVNGRAHRLDGDSPIITSPAASSPSTGDSTSAAPRSRGRSHSVITSSSATKNEDKHTNRQLEFEVYRLQKRIQKQEKELRSKYSAEIERWRNKYLQMHQAIMRADEWKQRYDIVCREREGALRREIDTTRSTLEDGYHKERHLAAFWRDKFKEVEDKLCETEARRREETDRWKALVRYYEEAFGVVAVNLVTDVGVMRRRQAHTQALANAGTITPASTDTAEAAAISLAPAAAASAAPGGTRRNRLTADAAAAADSPGGGLYARHMQQRAAAAAAAAAATPTTDAPKRSASGNNLLAPPESDDDDDDDDAV